jgi:hypothetical protein
MINKINKERRFSMNVNLSELVVHSSLAKQAG